jgi:hypothetical protein
MIIDLDILLSVNKRVDVLYAIITVFQEDKWRNISMIH